MFEYDFKCEKCGQIGKINDNQISVGNFSLQSLGGIPLLVCGNCTCSNEKTIKTILEELVKTR